MRADESDESAASWHPEADRAVLAALAKSINRAFGRKAYARADDGELMIQFDNKTAWIRADGSLMGEASTGPS
ncbi:MAG: hypothetical protein ABSE62_00140 [Chthoniobacteraceae bacterium]|jgi:hypothetical protein